MYNNMALKKANRHGEVSEWSIVPSWKGGVPQGTAGSNPVLSAIKTHTKGALEFYRVCLFLCLLFVLRGFYIPFFFLIQYGCRFLPTRYLTQELSNHRTISNFYNLCTKSSVRARRHKKIIAPLHP